MTRATSRIAWREMVESGALLGNQAKALEAVIAHGPATSGEIIRAAGLGENVNLWRARFTELLGRGLIREIGQRVDGTTGRQALVWEYTGRTKPLDLAKGEGRKITAKQRAGVVAALAGFGIDLSATAIDDVIRAAR